MTAVAFTRPAVDQLPDDIDPATRLELREVRNLLCEVATRLERQYGKRSAEAEAVLLLFDQVCDLLSPGPF